MLDLVKTVKDGSTIDVDLSGEGESPDYADSLRFGVYLANEWQKFDYESDPTKGKVTRKFVTSSNRNVFKRDSRIFPT